MRPGWCWLALGGVSVELIGCAAPIEESRWWSPDWDAELARVEQGQAAKDGPDTPSEDESALLGLDGLGMDVDASGRWTLSLESAVALALRENRDLAVARLEPVIAGTFERLERGVFNAEAFGSLVYSEQTASETDRGTGAQFSVDSSDVSAEAGVRRDLPTGTAVELSVSQERDTSNRAPEQQDARVGLTVTQQLLRGFGPAVNLARIEQAKLGTRASGFVLRGFAEALVADVEATYWALALAQREVSIVERSLAVAQRELEEAEQRIELGALAASDAAVVRVEAAVRRQALIDAQSRQRAERLRLLRLVGGEPGRASLDVSVVLHGSMETTAIALGDVSDRVLLARRSRPELSEARLRLEQDRLETLVTANGLLPRLEVFATFNKTGFADRFDRSFGNLDDDTYDLQAGLRFAQALGNDAAEARDEAARVGREQAARAVANLEQLVGLEVRLAANEIERVAQQVEASRITRELQAQVVEAERQRFEAGAGTALQVAQVERDLLEAQIAEARAQFAYRVALLELYVAEGSLLDRRGLAVRGG